MQITKIFERVFFGHRYDQWAEEQTLLAAKVLQQAAADILKAVDPKLEKSELRDGFYTRPFIRDHVAPITREVGEALAESIIEQANQALAELTEERLLWSRSPHSEPADRGFEGSNDLLASAAPLGMAAAVAVALPTVAVTSTTTLFGLAVVTTISWPVVAVGSGIALAGLAIGSLEGSKLRGKARARLINQTREYVVAALLKGTSDQPALLEHLEREFRETARKAKELLCLPLMFSCEKSLSSCLAAWGPANIPCSDRS